MNISICRSKNFAFCLDDNNKVMHKVWPSLQYYETPQQNEDDCEILELDIKVQKCRKFIAIDQLMIEAKNQTEDFLVDHSGLSTVIQSSEGFIYLSEKDKNGQISLKTLIVQGKVVHHQTFSYIGNGKLSKHSVKTAKLSEHRIYSYNNNGQILKVESNNPFLNIKFNYDLNGNIMRQSFNNGVVQTFFKFDPSGERIADYGNGNTVHYDENGNMVERNGAKFGYDDNGNLKSIMIGKTANSKLEPSVIP